MQTPFDRLAAAFTQSYRLERELGQGGMATVYLAQDLKHDRQVAIKVLRPELAAVIGADRFLSEIKTTANLQHPHILPLHDSGQEDGFLFYVMPYVQGETLRDRISKEKQLPVADAVRIAGEVASALDYAHRQGVIHRDIKPENILLHDGRALVADFGIALAVSTAGTRMTETGMSLGTPHYMSPEQAMGEREITARSDVYALGCVLYEMLTGDPPFTGSTAQAIVARVVTESPRPLTPQRHTIPPQVEAAVLTALEKLPADRFATAAEFAAALTSQGYTRPTTGVGAAPSPALDRLKRLGLVGWGLAVVLLGVALWGWLRPEPPRPVSRSGLAFPAGQVPAGLMTLAADGSRLVYQGPSDSGGQLWVKERDRYEATPLAGTAGAGLPATSPDGKWVAFVQRFQLKKMPVSGGAAIMLADSAQPFGIAWLDDGSLVYTGSAFDLRRVSETGGVSTSIWRDSLRGGALATPLPGGRGIVFTTCTQTCQPPDLRVLDLRSGASRSLDLPNAVRGWYLPTGHLAYVRQDGSMLAVPFDLKSLEVRGAPIPMLDGISLQFGVVPLVTISSAGTLIMMASGANQGLLGTYEMVWMDRAGRATATDSSWRFTLTTANGNIGWELSPDGTRLAIGLNTNSGDDIWIKQLPRGPLSRLTFDSLPEERPRWTPDGRSVMYLLAGTTLSVHQRRADGTGRDSTVLSLPLNINEGRWSRDGSWLIIRTGGNGGQVGDRDVSAFRPGVDSAPRPLLANPGYDESAAALSPDGRWLAYASDETGRTEVYVRPFPNVDDGKWQISTSGGQAPLWAHSGRELFFVDAGRNMMATPVIGGATFRAGAPSVLFRLDAGIFLTANEFYTPFDISPDDKRFIMARQVQGAQTEAARFILVENWFEELKAKVGAR